LTPAEALQRNFWFCTIDDPTTMAVRHRIGVDHIMVEVDYPHADSTWPGTQELLATRLADIPADEVDRMTHLNAAGLFRHPLPPPGWRKERVDA
ncbi:MAG: amidohydrolase family protein, partial [Actinomycetes bacterium]